MNLGGNALGMHSCLWSVCVCGGGAEAASTLEVIHSLHTALKLKVT